MEDYRKLLLLNWDAAKDLEHDYDIDEENKYSRSEKNPNSQEHFTVDDIVNILSNIESNECDQKIVESIKKYL